MPFAVTVDAPPVPVLRQPMSDGNYPIGSRSEELDETPYVGDKSYATPINMGMYQTLKKGQIVDRTTVYNPQPSDKEVEAVHGEKKYNPRPNPESPKAMQAKLASQTAEISELKGQMTALLAALNSNKPMTTESVNSELKVDKRRKRR